jgi:serine phosphatase RsbU (regulator of sigma subunit)
MIRRGGRVSRAAHVTNPPIGLEATLPVASSFVLEPGDSLVFFSDGMVERREESLDSTIAAFMHTLDESVWPVTASQIYAAAASADFDDRTVVVVHRAPSDSTS